MVIRLSWSDFFKKILMQKKQPVFSKIKGIWFKENFTSDSSFSFCFLPSWMGNFSLHSPQHGKFYRNMKYYISAMFKKRFIRVMNQIQHLFSSL